MTTFANCDQAYAAGYANMHTGEPGYSAHLDRDHDGVACETPPAGFKEHGTQAQTGTQAVTGSSATGALPTTGPGTEVMVGGGGVLLALGVAGVLLFRRRRTRFAA
jgi:LPXTG-motif cell wall-anchored protein